MTRERSAAPGECPRISIAAGLIDADRLVITGLLYSLDSDGCDARRAGGTGIPGRHIRSHARRSGGRSLHVVVVRILADVADIENDGLLAQILPPVRGAEYFGPDVAGLVQDRLGAVAGVFDDFALLNEDQRRTVVMAVPWHDAAGLDRQLAEAQLAVLEVGRLLLEIDRAERDVGDADRLVVDLLAGIGFHLDGGAFAGQCGRGGCNRA